MFVDQTIHNRFYKHGDKNEKICQWVGGKEGLKPVGEGGVGRGAETISIVFECLMHSIILCLIIYNLDYTHTDNRFCCYIIIEITTRMFAY